MSRVVIRAVVFAAVVACAASAAPRTAASEAPPPILHPKTYSSPSGQFTLAVDPSTMYGQGEATYRLRRNGKEVWSATHLFTLWDAIVTDDGTTAGYAYQYGPRGFAPGGRRQDPKPGQFHIAIFAPDGKARRLVSADRETSRFLHDAPNPLATGMFVDAGRRRLVVRLRNPDINDGGEQWRIFDLANGADLAAVAVPRPGASTRQVMAARPVADTPLVLLHWWHYDDAAARNPGGAFTLIDLTDPTMPREAWRHVMAGDYWVDEAKGDPDDVMEQIRRDGAILRCDEPKRFDLHFVAEKQRVTFEVTSTPERPTAWAVREVARAAYEPPGAPAPEAHGKEFATLPLIPLGELTLTVPGQRSKQPVRNVYAFDVDDRGRVGFVRGETGDDVRCAFVLLDADGNLAVDATPFLGAADAGQSSRQNVAWLGGDRWLITDSAYGVDAGSQAWFVDVDAQNRRAKVRKIDGFEASAVEAIVSTRDGGFAALCKRRHKHTTTDELCRYDLNGARAWTISSDQARDVLFSPQDVAFDPTNGGSVAVLNGIRSNLAIVGLDGRPKRWIDLVKSFGGKPNYVSHVSVASDGTFFVHDFNGSPPLWRLTSDGARIGNFTPRFADGRPLGVHELRPGGDDRVWTTDGSMIVRLDGKGVVDRALGDAPGAGAGGEIGAIAIDSKDRIYAAAPRGGVVRVFDASGKLLRTLKAAPEDFASDQDVQRLTVDGDGDVYIAGWNGPYLHLKADGTRAGKERLGLDSISEEWQFQPGTRKRWVAGYERVWLVDESGKPLREIRRQPDGRWIVHPGEMAVAPDGSLALCADDGPRRGGGGGMHLNFYTPAGEPVRTITLPFLGVGARVAFDGRRAVVAAAGELLVASAEDGSLRRLTFKQPSTTPSPTRETFWQPLFSPDGRELWLLDLNAKGRPIERYTIGE